MQALSQKLEMDITDLNLINTMVEITKIENQKNKNKFNLFVDGEFYSGILKETAITNNFFVGKKLEKAELEKILLESETKKAFEKASDYLGSRIHSKHELKLKLIKKGFSQDAIFGAIKKLEEYGYVSDKSFTQIYVNQNAKSSKKMLISKLLEKGVDKQTILEVLEERTDEQELTNATVLLEKYFKNKNIQESKPKAFAYLLRKGFDYSTAAKAMSKITNEDIFLED